MSVVHAGTSKKFASGWESIFGGSPKKSTGKAKAAAPKKTAKKAAPKKATAKKAPSAKKKAKKK